jgi:hypothetical protein
MRVRALPMILVDFSLVAGLATSGMLLVFSLIYLMRELGRFDPLVF